MSGKGRTKQGSNEMTNLEEDEVEDGAVGNEDTKGKQDDREKGRRVSGCISRSRQVEGSEDEGGKMELVGRLFSG